jgi:phosphoribosylamine-glycine ligase
MGTYSFANHSLPFLSKQDVLDAQQTNERVALELYKQTGQRFRGILYGGFMLTKKGVKVIEYNARFGDPEAMNVLSILETDFIEICNAVVSGSLASLKISFKNEATVCKYAVPVGYPDSPSKNFEVFCNPGDHNLYLAAVQKTTDGLIATGSRTAAFVGINQKIGIAEKLAEKGVSGVRGNLFHRKDIGTGALINLRIKHMKEILR